MTRQPRSSHHVRALRFVSLSVLLALVAGFAWADLEGPKRNDRYIAQIVSTLLQRQHLSGHALDDEMSERGFKAYLKTLDPMKSYFLQSDIDEFGADQKKLDDQVKEGDLDFSFKVFKRLLQRIDERVKVINELLEQPHDFTVDEEMIYKREKTVYAKDEAEAKEKWRRRIKYDLLQEMAEDVSPEEAKKKLHRRYNNFGRRMHKMDSDDVLEMYLTSITTAFDPHTTYMSPSTLENFEIQMRLELEGIGASLRDEDGICTVEKIIAGGAAFRDGRLKPKDQIVGVAEGEDGEILDVVDMPLKEVVKHIRGKGGTVVRLEVIPGDKSGKKVYKITRAKVELKDSAAQGEILEAGKKPDGGAYKIGVIDLPSFYMDMNGARLNLPNFRSTTRDVRQILDNFKTKGIDAVLIDLRHNGGGSLTESINLTGLFIDEGPVVQVKDSNGRIQAYDDTERGVSWDGPLVVLTSKLSASASEIFAGAIQDYHRGIIVGDHTTHGKGTVQSLLDLSRQFSQLFKGPQLGALKLTMQQFYRPAGKSTQQRGVVADVDLPSLTTHMDIGEADLDYPVKFDEVQKADFEAVDDVTPGILDTLRTRSAARRAKSEEFQKLLTRIKKYREQKDRFTISLNEKKFMAERSSRADAAKLLEDEEDETKKDGHVIKRDYYVNEVLDITADYIQALGRTAKIAGSR